MRCKSALLVVTIVVFFYGCTNNTADIPPETITKVEIPQEPSTLGIPIEISNSSLSKRIMSSLPNPLFENTETVNIPVVNPFTDLVPGVITVPTTFICDHPIFVKKKGWKCAACPPCCLVQVIVHEICNGTKQVNSLINKEEERVLKMEVPLYQKLVVNDLRFEGNGNNLFVHVKIDFELKASVETTIIKTLVASCGADGNMPQIELVLGSTINFGDEGTILLTNKKWDYKWNSPCNLTALQIPVDQLLKLPVIEQIIEGKINDLVQNKIPSEISLKSNFVKLWPAVSAPLKVGNFGYINFNISELKTDTLFATADDIRTDIGASCKPQFLLTDMAPTAAAASLPSLVKNHIDTGFSINLLGTVSLETLNHQAASALQHYSQMIDNKELEIAGIRLYQSDKDLVVQVSLSKPFKGDVFLAATACFDTAENTVKFKDLTYMTNSGDVLGKSADWLAHTGIIERLIQDKLQYKYEKDVSGALKSLAAFNQTLAPNIFLRGRLDKIKPVSVILSDNQLNIVIQAIGAAFVDVQ